MNREQLDRMRTGRGFVAALDQSGGSTPKALLQYGIGEDRYSGEEEMFDLVHAMRTRIIMSPAFTSDHILAAILFENTMNRTIGSLFTADYLWQRKGIVPILKVDQGLAAQEDGVQLMKPIPGLDALLRQAAARNVFGTKMRSVIHEANPAGIMKIAEQQFALGRQIIASGLVPILEPEVDIKSAAKAESEKILKKELLRHLGTLGENEHILLKLTIPEEDDFYADLIAHPRVVRVVALSGGYPQGEANEKLARNHGLIASFSRALSQGLSARQTDAEFNDMLAKSIGAIYAASIT